MTSFLEIVDRTRALLQERGRVTLRALRREFSLDGEAVEDLVGELVDLGVAAREGDTLVFQGDAPSAPRPAAVAPAIEPAPAPAPIPESGERRQLTVMFCDLVGSTELAQRLDPEELRQIVRAYREVCVEATKRFGGHVAQYLGDGVMVYFGWPQAHEDDAGRAIRAGLEIQRLLGERPEARRIAARIGVHSGLVVIGEDALALGATTNVAARIEGVARPGTVLVSHDTLSLCRGAFVARSLGAVELKGLAAPLELHEVERSAGVRAAAGTEGERLPAGGRCVPGGSQLRRVRHPGGREQAPGERVRGDARAPDRPGHPLPAGAALASALGAPPAPADERRGAASAHARGAHPAEPHALGTAARRAGRRRPPLGRPLDARVPGPRGRAGADGPRAAGRHLPPRVRGALATVPRLPRAARAALASRDAGADRERGGSTAPRADPGAARGALRRRAALPRGAGERRGELGRRDGAGWPLPPAGQHPGPRDPRDAAGLVDGAPRSPLRVEAGGAASVDAGARVLVCVDREGVRPRRAVAAHRALTARGRRDRSSPRDTARRELHLQARLDPGHGLRIAAALDPQGAARARRVGARGVLPRARPGRAGADGTALRGGGQRRGGGGPLPARGRARGHPACQRGGLGAHALALEALVSLPESEARDQQEIAIRLAHGRTLATLRGYQAQEVLEIFARVEALCAAIAEGPQQLPALIGLVQYDGVRGALIQGTEHAHAILRIAEPLGIGELLVLAHYLIGASEALTGSALEAEERLARASEILDTVEFPPPATVYDQDLPAVFHATRAIVKVICGTPGQALAAMGSIRERLDAIDHALSRASALSTLATAWYLARDPALARSTAEDALAASEGRGFHNQEAMARIILGWARASQGETDAGARDVDQGIALAESTWASGVSALFYVVAADAHHIAGGAERAHALLDQAIVIGEREGALGSLGEAAFARALLVLGAEHEPGAVEELLHQAADLTSAPVRCGLGSSSTPSLRAWRRAPARSEKPTIASPRSMRASRMASTAPPPAKPRPPSTSWPRFSPRESRRHSCDSGRADAKSRTLPPDISR